MNATKLIDNLIAKLTDWRGVTFANLRKVIRDADPEIIEEWKWMGSPVWSHDGIVCVANAFKDKVKVTFYEGAPLELFTADAAFTQIDTHVLGEVGHDMVPVYVVPAGQWQAARTTGAYTLVGCTVAPGFDFADFSMLADDAARAEQVRRTHPAAAPFI